MYKQNEAVKIVRSIMRMKGDKGNRIWNNLYPSGVRTVKCYRDRDHVKDVQLKAVLDDTLTSLGITANFKFTEPDNSPWTPGTGGFIVRLPNC